MAKDNPRLLLVDDDPSLLRLLTLRLEGEGYQVLNADCAEMALSMLTKQTVDVVLSDLRMPGLDGMSLFDEIAKRYKGLPVVLMTAHGSIPEAVAATQRGVFGFLTKPLNPVELREVLQRALNQSLPEQAQWRAAIITRSKLMQDLLEQAYRVAQRDVSVLITGASGTGKELLANAIHQASPRGSKPFVAINCGALPEHLLESELFGHSKGAFTGAVTEHLGLFREADGGTLFLDEIGDMPVALQVKLLRALQERQIRPVGSAKTIPINVRVLSATHRDLQQAMAEGQFREDLYYRLNVVNLQLPGLEQRAEDIPLLARHVLQQSADRHHVKVTRFSDDALQILATAKWPGNVRQLVNVVEQCVALTQSPIISAALVEQALSQNTSYWPTLTEARDQFERQYLTRVLQMTEGNVTRAADLAGRNRTDFYKLLKKHELSAQQITEQQDEQE
ncbi:MULTISPECIES: sigma 54-interacting transcriptional regulator [Gammaproteobacteria]|uniref:sigma 54-interacting transcriptional regulator n=1 Tax=Gammaproteobacteria TaxID=1236 RepID=UPI001E3856DE|nr:MULTISPECIES: sigma 54-interacting transcriptional regulator [Gammaproteobacteria]MDP4944144.1 sigma 54-interacting transcriptional regulator [Alishewanella sp.]MCC5450663.1 sigma 54-interacting transcriptional regulator [Rheinheimera sp. UJ51]MCF4008671.1 sigma 54-interacting transcriptional regulator [Rheinheimera sp. UJ63]MDP5035676.1 sigma 54-interacting transcriptional regulator [Alishewanella sp.]MDP5458991.1 sigma 54-interacting transcriptional regulator [Alishewanella sp. SMS8]